MEEGNEHENNSDTVKVVGAGKARAEAAARQEIESQKAARKLEQLEEEEYLAKKASEHEKGLEAGQKAAARAKVIADVLILKRDEEAARLLEPWTCSVCTFINGAGGAVCEICGQARAAAAFEVPPNEVNLPENEDEALASAISLSMVDINSANIAATEEIETGDSETNTTSQEAGIQQVSQQDDESNAQNVSESNNVVEKFPGESEWKILENESVEAFVERIAKETFEKHVAEANALLDMEYKHKIA